MNNLIIRSEQLDGVFVLQETMNRLVDQLSALSGSNLNISLEKRGCWCLAVKATATSVCSEERPEAIQRVQRRATRVECLQKGGSRVSKGASWRGSGFLNG